MNAKIHLARGIIQKMKKKKINFFACTYLHVDNRTKNKINALETEVKNLKLEVNSILPNVKEDNTKKIDTLQHYLKELNDEVKGLAKSIKNTELVLQLIEKDIQT